MKILSVTDIRKADALTIENEPIASVDLMERAAQACTNWFLHHIGKNQVYQIFCGNGNNGGDGLAIARQLHKENCEVEVYIVRVTEDDAPDFTINLKRVEKESNLFATYFLPSEEIVFPETNQAIIIDALLGTGLSREPEILVAEIIDRINANNTTVISIDIPSGLFADDNRTNSFRHVIKANHTLTFQQAKLSFLFENTAQYAGHFTILDIGLDPQFISEVKSPYYFVLQSDLGGLTRKRNKFSHKGSFGHALIVAGSEGKTGAASLAVNACLRSGVGLTTAHVPACASLVLQIGSPEAMLQFSENEKMLQGRIPSDKFSAMGIGPGLGTSIEATQSLKQLISEYRNPIVFDADALNILAENKTLLAFLPAECILTPHPREFDRLTEKHERAEDRFYTQLEFARKFNCYLVLKGAHTAIACPDGSVFFNSTGNPGMATGGSGDVLTGLITGLLAQDYASRDACILGVYLHGMAGDLAANLFSQEGMKASDLIDQLGNAWKSIS
jgi:ADP-dependent NAD(P)H-hydrate dehydratase / NAD(P)H-hydrate epimerase